MKLQATKAPKRLTRSFWAYALLALGLYSTIWTASHSGSNPSGEQVLTWESRLRGLPGTRISLRLATPSQPGPAMRSVARASLGH